MAKVIIVGCGFAGLTAARKLARRENIDLTLIDSRKAFTFKPLLPDIIGDRTPSEALLYPYKSFTEKTGARFEHAKVKAVDTQSKLIKTDKDDFNYDYAIISSGAETIFHGREDLRPSAYRADSVRQAERIIKALCDGSITSAVVVGGGYTGVEAATNLRSWSVRHSRPLEILLLEIGHQILAGLPEWMRLYCADNLRRLKIIVLTQTSVDSMNGKTASLSNGRVIENAFLLWSAGQRATQFDEENGIERDRSGRIVVDPYLRASDNCFVAGDAAGFAVDGTPLRFSAQFAVAEGSRAAGNILRQTAGQPIRPFRPIDPGYIIPMGNNRGCGRVFGLRTRGPLPVWMQFAACAIRSYGRRQKISVAKALARNLKTF